MAVKTEEFEREFRQSVRDLAFFDANCWYGRSDQPRRSVIDTIDEFEEVASGIGYARCNVGYLVSKYLKPFEGNDALIADVAGKQRFVPSIVLAPWMFENEVQTNEYLERMLKQGVRSVRMFPKTHHYLLNDWSYGYVLKLLEAYRLPLFIWSTEMDWNEIYETSQKYPKLPIVVEQCEVEAFFNLGYLMPLLEATSNVYLETNRVHEYLALDAMVERVGGGRFIYGSNMPVDDPYPQLAVITLGLFSQEDKRRIAHENLENLFADVQV
jgi:predicted TIM-barrel fold metal-dependent hydrolase